MSLGIGRRYDTVHHGMERGDNFLEGTLDTTYISSFGKGTRTLVSNTNISMATEEGAQNLCCRLDRKSNSEGPIRLSQVRGRALRQLLLSRRSHSANKDTVCRWSCHSPLEAWPSTHAMHYARESKSPAHLHTVSATITCKNSAR